MISERVDADSDATVDNRARKHRCLSKPVVSLLQPATEGKSLTLINTIRRSVLDAPHISTFLNKENVAPEEVVRLGRGRRKVLRRRSSKQAEKETNINVNQTTKHLEPFAMSL